MIYLDNAATTRPNGRALSRAAEYLTEKWQNPSGMYRAGIVLQGELKEARASLLSRVADSTAWTLVFTSCGSEADNQALFGYGRRGNVVTTSGEHAAIMSAAAELKNRGVEVRFAPLNADGSVNTEKLLSLVDEKTSLVSVIHVNNETGAVNDVNEIAKAVKAKNPRALFHSDGVQAFGKLPFRLGSCVDLYSVSAHKIGGLKGTGALLRKKSLPARPYIFGGGQESGERSGTENTFGIKVFEYAAEEKFRTLKEDFSRLAQERKALWSRLNKEIFIRISPEEGSPYILSVSAPGLRGEVLLHMADDKGLIVGTGSACSSNAKHRYSRVILACGADERTADGVLRLSFSPETTAEEAEKAADILNAVAGELREKMGTTAVAGQAGAGRKA